MATDTTGLMVDQADTLGQMVNRHLLCLDRLLLEDIYRVTPTPPPPPPHLKLKVQISFITNQY